MASTWDANPFAIDFSAGYTSDWRLMKVSIDTWADMEEVNGVKSVTINRDCTADIPMLESATVTLDEEVDVEFEEGYYRLEMIASQNGDHVYPVSTFYLFATRGSINRNVDQVSVTGSSVLQGAKDRLLLVGSYAPKGSNGATYVQDLLKKCIPAPVVIDDSFTLDDHVVFGAGISYLEAVWTVLDAAGWCLRITGDGTVHIAPKPEEPSLYLDRANAAMVQPGIDYTLDLSEIPNHYRAVDGDVSVDIYNEDLESRVSTVTRGRVKDYLDTNPIRVNGETLYAYARRQLEEMSTVVKTYSYKREYYPDVLPFDLVEGSLREVGLEGRFRILSQSLTCNYGITVAEQVGLEIKEFTA